jgi:hypothetical protein
MNLGLPVIAYGADTNYVTTEQKAHYFMSSEELVDVIGGLGKSALPERRGDG